MPGFQSPSDFQEEEDRQIGYPWTPQSPRRGYLLVAKRLRHLGPAFRGFRVFILGVGITCRAIRQRRLGWVGHWMPDARILVWDAARWPAVGIPMCVRTSRVDRKQITKSATCRREDRWRLRLGPGGGLGLDGLVIIARASNTKLSQ